MRALEFKQNLNVKFQFKSLFRLGAFSPPTPLVHLHGIIGEKKSAYQIWSCVKMNLNSCIQMVII